MATNGIELPVSLLIKNLQEIANLMKQFANKNVLADSLGGKKIDSELAKVLTRLELISAKSKTAFTTQSDFTSVLKDISLVELSLNKVHDTITNLGFSDLKVPEEFSGQIAALLGRIRELNGSLATFKGTLKEKLISNVDFMANLLAADPKLAAKWLEKGYDELYAAVNNGMSRVNTALALKAAEFEEKLKIITLNSKGQTSMTQWGALSFIELAFKTLPNDKSLMNVAQQWMSEFMKETQDGKGFAGFDKGAVGMNKFLKSVKELFSFSDEQMALMKARIRQLVEELKQAGEKATAATVVKKMGSDGDFAKQILFGGDANSIELAAKKYMNDIRDAEKILAEKTSLEGRSEAFAKVKVAFDIPNLEIKAKATEIAAALKVPEDALRGFENSILSAATKSPELAAMFLKATGEITTLTHTVDLGKQRLQSIDNTINKMLGISNFINRYVGLYAIVRKVTTAIRNAFNNIKELDKAITNIAVVTNMSLADLWGKIGEYTQMAQQYGVATKDVYTVSQIFYQQGLQTAQVMDLTTETLKMAKIASIDYTTAANAMTVAVRAFNLEMSEAQSVTDTYSALAAKFAVSSAEIANAMEKTASSAASVGMSLQSTSAFISVMEQTTRESAQNIGSALKSIISRYGEMKASPDKLLNVDGEEVAFNKVDTALASIGISIKDASGQFRNFDDVIMELASKWNTLDNNTQRYIATIMAGNRQQSRFIALVSNYDELSRAMEVANNSENASIVQVAKTMDSLESKANLVKNAFSQLYLDLHIEEGLKSAYDWLTRILLTLGKLGTLNGVLPTLMNVIGFGTGAKSIVKSGMDWLQLKKGKYEIETDEAQKLIEDIRTKASLDIIAKYKLEADLSLLAAALVQVLTLATSVAASIVGSMKGANPGMTSQTAYDALKVAYLNGQLGDPTKRAEFMLTMGIDPNSESGTKIEALLLSFVTLKGLADLLGTTLDNVKNASELAKAGLELTGTSGEKTSNDLNNLSNSTNNANTAENNEISASEQVSQTKLEEALANLHNARVAMNLADAKVREMTATDEGTRDKILSALAAAHSDYDKALAALKVVEGTEREKHARDTNTGELDRNSGALRGNTRSRMTPTSTDEDSTKLGISWKHNEWGNKNAMKIAGVASGVARMAGTAIVAAGALHLDKSTDTVETSKLLTGVGNGLSMAGTGASMGMSFGPWGAAIGAIGGLLLGGLGAILDGATMTLEELLALELAEAKTATDEALKALAKTLDLENSIDNIEKLREAMYNSTEDMEAYKDAMSTMANLYPSLISNYDEAGNAIIDLNAAENLLAETRLLASLAANLAAKAEAKTRETTIDILNSASNEIGKILEDVPYWVHTFTDESGKEHSFEESRDWVWRSIQNVALQEGQDLNNMSFNDFINFMRSTSTTDQSFNETRQRLFNDTDTIINNDGSVDFSKEFNYSPYVKELNNKLKSVSDKLNITPNSGLPSGEEYIYAFMGWEKDVQLTAARIQQVEEALIQRTNNYKGITKNLDKILPITDALVSLDQMLLDADTAKATKISSSKIASKLIANLLEAAAKERGMDAGTWSRSEDKELANAYEETKTEATQIVVEWFTGLSDKSLDETLNAFNSMTDYLSLDLMLQTLGYTDQADFKARSGLNEAESSALLDSWLTSFLEANVANRDRIIKTIYGLNEDGSHSWDLNADFQEGLGLLDGGLLALNIAYKFFEFDGATLIISKYADYFTTLLLDINELAELGYTQLASTRLAKLDELATLLASNPDMLQDLFGIITNIDFSDFESLLDAVDLITEYGEANGIDVSGFTTILTKAISSLIFNVNTLALDVTAKITNAAKKVDSIASTNKSGLSFDKAIEEYESLAATLGNDTTFDTLFTYDASLGKYIYTKKGLETAIELNLIGLTNSVELLNTTNGKYTELLQAMPNYSNAKNTQLESADELNLILSHHIPKELGDYLELLVNGFFADTTIEHTLSTFYDYVQQQVKNNLLEADKAQQLLENYYTNLANQYYLAIDWSLLALGTDFSGKNRLFKDQLISQINANRKQINPEIAESELLAAGADWETVIDAYLEDLYKDSENKAELIALEKERLMGSIEQSKSLQVSTAISEVLKGAGGSLSDATKGLLLLTGQFDNLVTDSGLLESGQDYVQSALTLYDSAKENFNTLTEANQSYLEIINASFSKILATQKLLSSGNSLDFGTIESSFTAMGLNLDEYYNAATGSWYKAGETILGENGLAKLNENGLPITATGGLEDIFTTDIFGNTKILDWDKYINWIAEKTGKKIDEIKQSPEYEKYRQSYVEALIGDANNADEGKSMVKALSALSSAKVGERVNIDALKLSDELLDALSGERGDGWIEIVSEAERDQLLAAIEVTEDMDEEVKHQLREILKNIYRADVDKLNDALNQVESLMTNSIISTDSKLFDILKELNMVDDSGVIKETYNMIAVYEKIYEQMQATSGKTHADLNAAYARVLTANDLKDIDTLDALENAAGMTYDALGELLAKYEIDLEEFMGRENNGIGPAGFGKVRITDWDTFARAVGLSEIDMNTPEYREAYSNWVDSMIELKDNTVKLVFQQDVADQIAQLSDAKAGDSLNVAYLEHALGDSLGAIVTLYGAELENGILTLGPTTNIPGLMQELARASERAGEILPELFAELTDAIAEMLSDITGLIENGIEGSLNHSDALKLNTWYRDALLLAGIPEENILDLQFTKTKDGLKLSNKEATKLYRTVKDIDALLGEIVFDALQESLIATDDKFKSVLDTAAYARELTREIRGIEMINAGVSRVGGAAGSVLMFDLMNGNVNLYKRKLIARPDLGEGVYSTIETSTYDSRNFETDIPFVMNLTPIPPDAQTFEDILSDSEVADYILGLLDKNPINGDAILDLDKVENGGKGLIINLREEAEITDEIVQEESARAQVLHEVSEVYEAIKDGEEFDSTKIELYLKELELALEIMRVRSTTEDDSFKFMELDIPSGLNNPLNYWENWGKAYEAINDSIRGGKGKTGYMEYTDFYNLATEMGHLAEITGSSVNIGGRIVENALQVADLIAEAGSKLENVDGTMKINLSGVGIDFAASADEMAANVDEGIHVFAQSQVDMLDSMISLLETVVAMEQLGDLDVDNDMVISVPEILLSEDGKTADGRLDDTDTWIEQYGSKYKKTRDHIIEAFTDDNGKLNACLSQVTVNGHTMLEILNASEQNLRDWDIKATDLSTLLTNLYLLSTSDLFDIDKPWESFMELFSGMDWGDLVIGANAGNHLIILTDEGSYSIDYTSDAAIAKIKGALPEWENKSKEEITKEVLAIIDLKNAGKPLEVQDNYVLHVLTGDIKVIKDDKGNTTYKVGNTSYDTLADATAASDIILLDSDATIDVYNGVATGQINFNGATISITSTGKGTVLYVYAGKNGSSYIGNSKEDAYKAAYEDLTGNKATEKNDKDVEIETEEYKTWKVKSGLALASEVTINGKTANVLNDPKVRQAIEDVRKQTDEEIEKMLNPTGNGKYTMDLGDNIVITFDESEITVDGQLDMAKVREQFASLLGLDTALAGTITEGIKNAFGADGIPIENLKITPLSTLLDGDSVVLDQPIAEASGTVTTLKVEAKNVEAEGKITDAEIKAMLKDVQIDVTIDKETAIGELNDILNKSKEVDEADPTVNVMTGADTKASKDLLSSIANTLSSLLSKTIEVHTKYTQEGTPPKIPGNNYYETKAKGDVPAQAAGNFGIAKVQGTLMGELGPELVVSGGRYFVAGQNGAEFVDLAADAIVFNHLQTEQLLKNGLSPTRGKTVTNERNAVAYALGNIHGGPAMASASAALAALKQLKAMWESLLNSTVSDLAGMGASGGGGGGGATDTKEAQNWVKLVERWYDLMQKISKLEKDINEEEALRNKLSSDFLKNGAAYYESQKRSLQAIEQLMIALEQLNIDRRDYYQQRLDALEESPLGQIYGFEDGQMYFKEGMMQKLTDLYGFNSNGEANYTLEEKYNEMVKMGLESYMQMDSSGNRINKADFESDDEYYKAATEAARDRIDDYASETQSLYDKIRDGEKEILELGAQRNELLQEIRDNQMELEDKMLDAIVSLRLQAIDALEDERGALELSVGKYIDGLNDALNKEKEMYSTLQDEEELNRMRRQLGILLRSGAPASLINSLQDSIRAKEQDQYFNYQLAQIDKILEASDLELERLDTLINLMTETLEYEKEHGLLWAQVYDYLFNHSAMEIADFILLNDTEMWGASPLRYEDAFLEALFNADAWLQFVADLDALYLALYNKTPDQLTISDAVYGGNGDYDWTVFNNAMTRLYGDQWKSIADTYKSTFFKNYSTTGSINSASSAVTKEVGSMSSKVVSAINSLANTIAANNNNSGSPGGSAPPDESGSRGGRSVVSTTYQDAGNSGHKVRTTYSDGTSSERLEAHNWDRKVSTGGTKTCYCSKCNHYMGIVYPGSAHFSQGGVVDYTGPAMVHGSKSRPESVLNADQTKILRDNILSNKPNSLISLLQTYNDSYNSNTPILPAGEGVIIENATVEMHIDQISNDYDARRAGELALSEIMRIARRTSAKNSIGR